VDLRRLEYFLAVVEHGRVTSAAAALHVAQPSLSQAIRALERDLGVDLFVRSGRGLTPTPAGLALVDPARRVLRDLASARAAVADVVDLSAGWLDIAAHDQLTFDPLAPVLAAFHRRYAGVPVRVHDPRSEEDLVRLLIDGQSELALAYVDGVPNQPSALRVRRLGAHEVWAILPPDAADELAPVPDPLPVGLLNGRALIGGLGGFGAARRTVGAALAAAGVRLKTMVRTRHDEAVPALVAAGTGWALTSKGYAQEAARSGAVVRRLHPTITCDFALLQRAGGLSPAARGFVAVLMAEIGGSTEGELEPFAEVDNDPNGGIDRVDWALEKAAELGL
jgi:DNA-binding transcriptional LysR family regulator